MPPPRIPPRPDQAPPGTIPALPPRPPQAAQLAPPPPCPPLPPFPPVCRGRILADGNAATSGVLVKGVKWQASGVLEEGANLPGQAVAIQYPLTIHQGPPGTTVDTKGRQRTEILSWPPAAAGETWVYSWRFHLAGPLPTSSKFFHLTQILSRVQGGFVVALGLVQNNLRISSVLPPLLDPVTGAPLPLPEVDAGRCWNRTLRHEARVRWGTGGFVDYQIHDALTGETLLQYYRGGPDINVPSQGSIKCGLYRAHVCSPASAVVGDFSFCKPKRRRLNGRTLERVLLVVLGGVVLWAVGRRMGTAAGGKGGGKVETAVKAQRCDPYSLPGHLQVSLNPSERHLNRWIPALSTCKATDYLSMLLDKGPWKSELEWLRGRTVVLFGDSVDRGFAQHLCMWAHEREELIDEEHPLAPPYPPGREYPPPGYRWDGTTTRPGQDDLFWPGVPFGRPHVCTIRKYDFTVVQVFQFGVDDEDEWLTQRRHFYPPGGFEERFDQILLPLLENLATRKSNQTGRAVSPVPDLVSFSSTFWTPFRHVRLLQSRAETEWEKKLDTWAPPRTEFVSWFTRRWTEAVRHVGVAWPAGGEGEKKRPKLVFRELQQIFARDDIPSNHVEVAIQVGRRVVDVLREEGEASLTEEVRGDWKAGEGELGKDWVAGEKERAREMGLGRRLEVLDWGRKFEGQQVKYTDDGAAGVHPHPLPGSWLFWNMLLDILHRHVKGEGA
ncbi:hypothetical protein JCM8547_007651 [Rhodosporidiobolus lusitaniae]